MQNIPGSQQIITNKIFYIEAPRLFKPCMIGRRQIEI